MGINGDGMDEDAAEDTDLLPYGGLDDENIKERSLRIGYIVWTSGQKGLEIIEYVPLSFETRSRSDV